jgi:hypothetical protein
MIPSVNTPTLEEIINDLSRIETDLAEIRGHL